MSACRDVRTTVSAEEAWHTVEPYFDTVKKIFIAAGATRVKKVTLEIATWIHDKPRHFMATDETGRLMLAAPEVTEKDPETLIAIVAHEFGHAVDFLYPAEFVVIDDGELVRYPPVPDKLIDHRAEQANLARSLAWRDRDAFTVERTADAIAEHFTGHRIGYCGPCELQCFDRGKPRRPGLR